MPKSATTKAKHVINNRAYEERRQARGMVRISVWVPESEREMFMNAAKTYQRLHRERLDRLKPSA